MKKYKADIIFWITLIVILFGSYKLRGVVFPFYIGFGLAYLFNPIIKKVQLLIKNRILATITTLLLGLILFLGITALFANEISRDINRLGATFSNFREVNSKEIDESANWVKDNFDTYIQPLLDRGETKLDSISNEGISSVLEKDSLMHKIDFTELKKIGASIFNNEDKLGSNTEKETGVNWILVMFSSVGYFLYIIFSWPYFESKLALLNKRSKSERLSLIFSEVKSVFKAFFQQRGLIALIYSIYFVLSFYLIGIPGALILGLFAGVLCFIPYLQYIVLLPIALCCVILNMEGAMSYIFYLAISVGIFVIGSLLEELLLIPKIMKQENSINPAILLLSVAVFGELMGLFGVMFAVPFTILLKSYLKKIIFLN